MVYGWPLWSLVFGLWALGFGLWSLGFGLWALPFDQSSKSKARMLLSSGFGSNRHSLTRLIGSAHRLRSLGMSLTHLLLRLNATKCILQLCRKTVIYYSWSQPLHKFASLLSFPETVLSHQGSCQDWHKTIDWNKERWWWDSVIWITDILFMEGSLKTCHVDRTNNHKPKNFLRDVSILIGCILISRGYNSDLDGIN